MHAPKEIRSLPKFDLLQEENVDRFNSLVDAGQTPDVKYSNLSGLDLRNAKLTGLDLSGCYFRGANLSGLDLSGCNLYGASLRGVNISGVLFPSNIPPEELRLSVEHGTRIRIRRQA
jgi:uncharacterized protein YjbI with pentapeptide repeats